MQKPETETRRFFSPETQQYKDTSGMLRKESDIQSRMDMENASRFSGGGIRTNCKSRKKFSREQLDLKDHKLYLMLKLKELRELRLKILAQEIKAKATNLQLANQYDALDAQNKAAIDAYFNQGIHDVGRISQQRKMDTKAKAQQSLMLKMLEDRNFRYDENG